MSAFNRILDDYAKRGLLDGNAVERLSVAHQTEIAAGNAAAMREALLQIQDLADAIKSDEDEANAFAILDLCCAALSAPPRNCDVGTPGDQAARFNEYCDNQPSCPKCEKCLYGYHIPCFNDIQGDCMCVWAQMPYKKGANNE